MGKMSAVKRTQTAKEVILQFLKDDIIPRSADSVQYYADKHGFTNNNTVRGRLSELMTEGTILSKRGWDGVTRYEVVQG